MVSKGALADSGSHAAVAASTPTLRMAHACPCAQLHMATVTWPLQSSHIQSHIHTQSSLPGPCSHLRYLGHGAHGYTCMRTPLPTHDDILTLPYICTCAYELYCGHMEVRTDTYSVHSCPPLASPGMGKQLPQGALGEHFPHLRLCS